MGRRGNRRGAPSRDEGDAVDGDVAAAAGIAAAAVVPPPPPAGRRTVAAHVRDRQRAVAEREASRLARPDRRPTGTIAHADRKKSAVTSTPFGTMPSRPASSSSRPGDGGNDDDDDGNVEEWCGPFSVARQMIARREAAKRKREEDLAENENRGGHHPLDALMDQVHNEQKRRAHPSMQWKSRVRLGDVAADVATTGGSLYAKRQRRFELSRGGGIGGNDGGRQRVPSLVQLCVNFVVRHFDHVESLGDVDNDVRLALSKELVGTNRLDGRALEALVNGSQSSIETLEVVDCAGIPQETMAATLAGMSGLRYLLLTHAGRAFGSKAVAALLDGRKDDDDTVSAAGLSCLDISGAYLLTDADAARLVRAYAGTLRSVAFATCPLLGEHFVRAVVDDACGGCLLELSLQDVTLKLEDLQILTSGLGSKRALKGVRALTLQSIPGLTDDLLAGLLETTGDSLGSLNVSHNHGLTDDTLSAIRRHNPRLKTLAMNGVRGLSAAGLEATFTHPLRGLPPPPKLRVLELGSVDHQTVTDEVLRLVTAAASSTAADPTVDGESVATEAPERRNGGNGGLVELDVQGSTSVTDTFLEGLVETSYNTLQQINVSYCPLITDQGLGYLVSKAGRQLKKIQVWGCAQLTDDFFDGHDRIQDHTLEIVGAWMKKSGTRFLR